MNDELIIDPEVDAFVKNLHRKYPESQLVLDKRKDPYGIMYLYLIGLSIRKQSRGEGIATKVIQEVFKYADEQQLEVHAWACNIFGTDLNTWVPFLEEIGFVKIDKENNLIYFPK
jgi:GNAT superfamily N-acetyltransferase